MYDGTGYSGFQRLSIRLIEIVKKLIQARPEVVNEISTGGATPLHTCGMSRRGQLLTQVLIDHGANVNAVDTYGYTAAGMASNNLRIGAEALIRAGAPIGQKTGKPYSGETAISIAKSSHAYDVLQFLVEYSK